MQSITNILPETNYIPSGERWEYKYFYTEPDEKEFAFLKRSAKTLAAERWEIKEILRSPISNECFGAIFKRKLIIK